MCLNTEVQLVELLPPQEGVFMTRAELDDIIRDRTNIVDRLLKVIEENKEVKRQ